MVKNFIKHERLYITNANKRYIANDMLNNTSIPKLPIALIEREVDALYWKKRMQYKLRLREWIQQFNEWQKHYDKKIADAKLRQQIGINVHVAYDPPAKPILTVLLGDEAMLEWITDLHNQHMLRACSQSL
eukprot:870743_1